jgi:hypothetical protein
MFWDEHRLNYAINVLLLDLLNEIILSICVNLHSKKTCFQDISGWNAFSFTPEILYTLPTLTRPRGFPQFLSDFRF